MKMLYPRKMDDVLWHSATRRFSKSILVKIPRLPTILVIGSQFISTRFRDLVGVSLLTPAIVLIFLVSFRILVRPWVIARSEFGAWVPPFRLLVYGGVGHGTQCSDRAAIYANRSGGNTRAGRLVHEGHELVRETWHGATNTDSADVGAAANSGHPSSFGDFAVHDWTPAAELHNAFRGAVLLGEISLLVVTGAVATVMYGLPE